jgi:hypothetical protein
LKRKLPEITGPASSILVVPVDATPLVSPSVEVNYRASSQASKQATRAQ